MKMTMSTASTMTPRLHHRKLLRLSGKRPGVHRSMTGKGRPCVRQTVEACENSDDSGLGFDHPMDIRALHYSERNTWIDAVPDIKRRKLDLKLENDETNDNYCFPESLKNCKDNTSIIRTIPSAGIQNLGRAVGQNVNTNKPISRCVPLVSRRGPANGPVTLTTQLTTASRNGKIHLQIVCQPEQQHRARYQTEGSRGAVKDRTGNGFPMVKLMGYEKPATLQVFIGTDQGRVAPHMFYQACRVSGKNSTPCVEKKIDGTIVIEVELDPTKEMVATCDCVGILKERNVDVEHRFPEQLGSRSKKKSTRCRMVFRTSITNDDGSIEMLQVCSQPIVCTQPPGIPEICKKSLTTCPVSGGIELFILGKNFLKDTRVVFQQAGNRFDGTRESEIIWEEFVAPDKEYLQQTHLVCVVPPYLRQDITEPVTVRLFVISSGKNSEPHTFAYTPIAGAAARLESAVPTQPTPFLSKMLWQPGNPKQELNPVMMPPPTTLVPVAQRRPSALMDNHHSPPMRSMKTEVMDENSQGSTMDHIINENSVDSMRLRFRSTSDSSLDVHHEESNITMINENSLDMLRRQDIINENSNVSIINENSMDVSMRQNAFHCEKSNHSVHNEENESRSSVIGDSRILSVLNPPILVPTMVPTEISQTVSLTRDDLKGIDLRMKGPISTLNDLADTQTPSLATLREFVVTESTNMPLPAQTGQSVENFLTTLENTVNKPVLSDTMANNSKIENEQLMAIKVNGILENKIQMTALLSQQVALSQQVVLNRQVVLNQQSALSQQVALSQLLSSEEQNIAGANKMFTPEQVLSSQQVLTSSLLTNPVEIIPTLMESHIKPNDTFEHSTIVNNGQVIFSPVTGSNPLLKPTQPEVLKQESNMILTQQSLQAALNGNLLPSSIATPKLDALVNSTVESHISPIRSPQQEILSTSPQELLRRSPLLQASEIMINASSEVLLNTQSPLLSSTIAQGSELLIATPQNDLTHQDVILNPQVSPSVICAQDALLNGSLNSICQPNSLESCLQTSQLQQEILPETELRNTSNSILSTLNIGLKPTLSADCLVMNAAAEMVMIDQAKSTQNQIINTLFEPNSGSASQEGTHAMIMKNLLISQLPPPSFESAPQNVLSISEDKSRNAFLSQVENTNKVESAKQLQDQPIRQANEMMVPPALTNMSENDLLSYINTSCFDSEGTYTA